MWNPLFWMLSLKIIQAKFVNGIFQIANLINMTYFKDMVVYAQTQQLLLKRENMNQVVTMNAQVIQMKHAVVINIQVHMIICLMVSFKRFFLAKFSKETSFEFTKIEKKTVILCTMALD